MGPQPILIFGVPRCSPPAPNFKIHKVHISYPTPRFVLSSPPAPRAPSERLAAHAMLGRLAPRRRALSSVTRALRPLRVGGVPEHFNTPWHTAIAAGRFDELGLQVDR